jgi:hypothetical protein
MTRSVYQSTSDRTDLRSPDAIDPYNGVPVSVVSTPVTSFREPGFDWADAGIGAAALLALALLGFGATLVTRRTHGHAIG